MAEATASASPKEATDGDPVVEKNLIAPNQIGLLQPQAQPQPQPRNILDLPPIPPLQHARIKRDDAGDEAKDMDKMRKEKKKSLEDMGISGAMCLLGKCR